MTWATIVLEHQATTDLMIPQKEHLLLDHRELKPEKKEDYCTSQNDERFTRFIQQTSKSVRIIINDERGKIMLETNGY